MSPGVHTRTPPSKHAMDRLRQIIVNSGSLPCQEVNFTVRDKLHAFGYIEIVWGASPYKSHKPGHRIQWMQVTETGRKAAAEAPCA